MSGICMLNYCDIRVKERERKRERVRRQFVLHMNFEKYVSVGLLSGLLL